MAHTERFSEVVVWLLRLRLSSYTFLRVPRRRYFSNGSILPVAGIATLRTPVQLTFISCRSPWNVCHQVFLDRPVLLVPHAKYIAYPMYIGLQSVWSNRSMVIRIACVLQVFFFLFWQMIMLDKLIDFIILHYYIPDRNVNFPDRVSGKPALWLWTLGNMHAAPANCKYNKSAWTARIPPQRCKVVTYTHTHGRTYIAARY